MARSNAQDGHVDDPVDAEPLVAACHEVPVAGLQDQAVWLHDPADLVRLCPAQVAEHRGHDALTAWIAGAYAAGSGAIASFTGAEASVPP
ncbi:hypothetical protein AB0F52_01770 [Amycolatopsis sp. NPDC024027]|uniref:hypothetical protein n=1 Tax=Amycolatopsis sp. NPDC024027 TaxID=3154327 RepID=UPI0034023DD1